MDRYYYLISQLPTLYFDKPTFMTIESFLRESRKWLSRRDYIILSRIKFIDTELDKKGPRLWKEYRAFESRFRNEIARWRKAQREEQGYKPATFSVNMLKEGNPLEIERKLLFHRWELIEEKEKMHHFDLGFLILYYLKLQILQRLSLFDKKKGQDVFQGIVSDIQGIEYNPHGVSFERKTEDRTME